MEYFYLEVGEEIEIKISAEQLKQISSANRPCIQDENFSASEVCILSLFFNIKYISLFNYVPVRGNAALVSYWKKSKMFWSMDV